ncbi:hypothetical protein [Mesorhizobium huakuii]|uniref:Uncharacterized protein n=1 Tax=Mesorhizobium huakuii TaxID=28104 RepID=A0A7G6T063_9HYPH|nr:hypothetical protein [Mesorhizobium huakuii]QND60145.1 hypothetical protein HB778_29070 [Mesorhizobium huakuii]
MRKPFPGVWALAMLFVSILFFSSLTVHAMASPPLETQQVFAQTESRDNPPPNSQKTETTKAATTGTDQSAGVQQPPKVIETFKSNGTTYYSTKHPWEIYLTACTVVLLICMTLILTAIAWRTGFTPDFQKSFVILTVIFASLFLIVAGYSDQQTAPVFSLLGAIIGYVFGRVNVADQILSDKIVAAKQLDQTKTGDVPDPTKVPSKQTPPF